MDSPTALALAIETTANGTGQVLRTRAAVKTYILRLGPFMLREKLMRERALSTDQPIVLFISAPPLFSSSNVPGMLVACGRHGRRPPWVIDA